MAKTTTQAIKTQSPMERAKLLGGGVLFGLFAYMAFTSVLTTETLIFGGVCAVLSIVGFWSGIRGYDELKKR